MRVLLSCSSVCHLRCHGHISTFKAVYAGITHAILSGPAIQRINDSNLTGLIVTNSCPHEDVKTLCPKIQTINIGPLLAEAVRRTHNGESISYLFNNAVQ